MPDSVIDYSAQITMLERKLRLLRRNILGIAEIGRRSLENSSEVPIFEVRLEAANSYWEEFQTNWSELDYAHVNSGTNFPTQEWQTHYDQLLNELYVARSYLLIIQRQAAPAGAGPADISQLANTFNLGNASKAHLPKIPIPEFNGDLWKWRHFRDTFVSLVHEDSNLSEVEKLHYLLGAAKGEVASLLARFPVEGRSYALAWAKMKSTYDNTRVLANVFLQRIVEYETRDISDDCKRYESFLTNIADSIEAFKSLNLSNVGEVLLAFLALRALDNNTRKQFELSHNSLDKFPISDDVIGFVRQRLNALKLSGVQGPRPWSNNTRSIAPRHGMAPARGAKKYDRSVAFHTSTPGALSKTNPKQSGTMSSRSGIPTQQRRVNPATDGNTAVKRVCSFCQGDHLMSFCSKFASLSSSRRRDFIRSWKGCINCLREGHKVKDCPSQWSCKFCHKRHHTLVHEESGSSQADTPHSPACSQVKDQNFHSSNSFTTRGYTAPQEQSGFTGTVLLGTVKGYLKDDSGAYHPMRAVLDSGSERTFVTEKFARRIGVPFYTVQGSVTGIGETIVAKSENCITCVVVPYPNAQEFRTEGIVLESISSALPSRPIDQSLIHELYRHGLADVSFSSPGPVDMLIGSDLYPQLITGAPFRSEIDGLFLIPSVFGHVVLGKLADGGTTINHAFFSSSNSEIDARLRSFWEIEEPCFVCPTNPEDDYCEHHFSRTHYRTPTGQYVVSLPLKEDHRPLGDNREVALRRFLALERKLKRDSTLCERYVAFMHEYEELGHMSQVKETSKYIIPHHAVWQNRPEGCKLRVVFDASCIAGHHSLNDILLSGPKLQVDLGNILILFRLYAIPFCTDIVKMYRQILVHPSQRLYQHILWRDLPSKQVCEYELNTVTYGLKPSAFLAMRVIKQLIADEGSNYPLAADRLASSMYVDDLVTGADTLEEAIALRHEVEQLLNLGGFKLAKWASTVPELIPPASERIDSVKMHDETDFIKVLGLIWKPKADAFSYDILPLPTEGVTKRIVLSAIARIFDPLGFLSPVIFVAKTILQEIWKEALDWDEYLPYALSKRWEGLARELLLLPQFAIKRYIAHPGASYRLVGFSDASEDGYAANVYLRSQSPDGQVTVSLLKSKTKVAPLKFTSIPRLELCGALLLARLISSIQLKKSELLETRCYTDSTVVLAWLRAPLHTLRVYEANRVSSIIELTPLHWWRHVQSEDNPADIASRGCMPSELQDNKLWWHGPRWLELGDFETSEPPYGIDRGDYVCVSHLAKSSATKTKVSDEWMLRFSSYQRLIRATVFMLRFISGIKGEGGSTSLNLTASELQLAEQRCVRNVQIAHLPTELFNIVGNQVPKGYASLSPFIDDHGIVRVGGRLQNAPISPSTKHPALLPRTSHFAKLVVEHMHTQHFHAGPTLTLALLRGKFWIPNGLKFVRSQLARCIPCRIRKAQPSYPMMASLPSERFSQGRAFINVGVDFAGPFMIKESSRKKAALGKAYLCLFICMASKAVHLEAVSALTTAAFLATLDRFMARRGMPETIYSDHGTNFVGASRFLKDLYGFIAKHESQVVDFLSGKGITWKHIPPRAPNFGGLWEAGIKSAKSLLSSVLGKQAYTFEELATLFTRIEAILNSRPLCPLREDAEDFDFLTPGHFLIGSSFATIPEPSDVSVNLTASSQWTNVHSRVSLMWDRWRKEYLHHLQQRSKWRKMAAPLCVGDLVVLREKLSLVGSWPVGRVTEVHPGQDNIIRVVTVRIPSGKEYIRAVNTLVPLLSNAKDGSGTLCATPHNKE